MALLSKERNTADLQNRIFISMVCEASYADSYAERMNNTTDCEKEDTSICQHDMMCKTD